MMDGRMIGDLQQGMGGVGLTPEVIETLIKLKKSGILPFLGAGGAEGMTPKEQRMMMGKILDQIEASQARQAKESAAQGPYGPSAY